MMVAMWHVCISYSPNKVWLWEPFKRRQYVPNGGTTQTSRDRLDGCCIEAFKALRGMTLSGVTRLFPFWCSSWALRSATSTGKNCLMMLNLRQVSPDWNHFLNQETISHKLFGVRVYLSSPIHHLENLYCVQHVPDKICWCIVLMFSFFDCAIVTSLPNVMRAESDESSTCIRGWWIRHFL